MNMTEGNDENDKDGFKLVHSKHRRRPNDPNRSDDLDELVDFGSNRNDERITQLTLPKESSKLSSIYRGSIFGLNGLQGFMFCPQALAEPLQSEIAYRCVSEYCERPHRTNIDLCPPRSNEVPNHDDQMWELWKAETYCEHAKKRKPNPNNKRKYRSFKKLSWATTGMHYDWTQRAYHEGCKSPMPALMEDVAIIFARTSLLLEPEGTSLTFTPSASIVNFYNQKSNMGGHKDDLEVAIDKPVVSFSVGLPAIFLLGGKTRQDKNIIPILVRPGDVMCMGGDSRLNYHSMARVLPPVVALPTIKGNESGRNVSSVQCSDVSQVSEGNTIPEADKAPLEEYLLTHRININVRQVYPDAN